MIVVLGLLVLLAAWFVWLERTPQKVVCAWCKVIIRHGSDPASHGICESCAAKMVADDD